MILKLQLIQIIQIIQNQVKDNFQMSGKEFKLKLYL